MDECCGIEPDETDLAVWRKLKDATDENTVQNQIEEDENRTPKDEKENFEKELRPNDMIPDEDANYLDYNLTNSDLFTIFSTFGKVTKATILKDRATYQSRGVAFILFISHDDVIKAIKGIDKKILNGRTLCTSTATDNGRALEFIRKKVYKDRVGVMSTVVELDAKNVIGMMKERMMFLRHKIRLQQWMVKGRRRMLRNERETDEVKKEKRRRRKDILVMSKSEYFGKENGIYSFG
ncbi:unnamed protein product [Fraxinus pennsylvanica]|uniref:RRM domain-containing protein n=1 Tax=Fraxinus pennsylvanica TaxID=56036 RepID=A0AAD2DIN6_9LAMI|nr:unnamed protein product [Fraxinus pennsylvanica]